MTDAASSHATPPRALVQALRHAMRPLVKLMLSRGLTFAYANELLKGLFVEVAERDFRLEGKSPTDSRVSLVSGVHRKEVSRLRQMLDSGEETMPEVVSLGAQLVAQWMGAAPYVDEQGNPRPLARFASEGGELSFESLVARVNRDIRPRVVLDEWLRLGVASIDDQGFVRLDAGAFVPSKGFEELSFYLGHNLHDHAAAAAHNLMGGEPAFMERSVHYSGLSAEDIGQLEQQAGTLGMQALVAVNKNALSMIKRAGKKQFPPQRMTFGVYFYAAPLESQGSAQAGDRPVDAEQMPASRTANADSKPATFRPAQPRTSRAPKK